MQATHNRCQRQRTGAWAMSVTYRLARISCRQCAPPVRIKHSFEYVSLKSCLAHRWKSQSGACGGRTTLVSSRHVGHMAANDTLWIVAGRWRCLPHVNCFYFSLSNQLILNVFSQCVSSLLDRTLIATTSTVVWSVYSVHMCCVQVPTCVFYF